MKPKLKLLGDKESPVRTGCETVTLTLAAVAVLPEEAAARAESGCGRWRAVVVFQLNVYGGVVTGAPIGAPSNRNCTPATATLSEAEAVTATVPETVVPDCGAVIATVGGVVSGAA